MLQNQIISASDLRYKTKNVLQSLTSWAKYILLNNKLKGVIVSPSDFEYFNQLKKAQELKLDLEEAKSESPIFSNAQDLIADLNS